MKGSLYQIAMPLVLIGLVGSLRAQAPDSLRFQGSIPALAAFATSDHFANTYLISQENAIVKYDSVGRQIAEFTNNRLGRATFLDASNPLKILVWYPDFQTVVLLDRTLTEMGRLNFLRVELYAVRCVAMAFDGNIWAFDDAVSKAVKLSLDGAVLLESPPLNVYFPQRFSATRIRDSGRLVYLNDPASGLCALDQYANLENAYNTFRMTDFETDGEWLVYLEKDRLCLQNQTRLQLLYVPLPPRVVPLEGNAWLGKRGLFLQRGRQVEHYRWK